MVNPTRKFPGHRRPEEGRAERPFMPNGLLWAKGKAMRRLQISLSFRPTLENAASA